MLYLSMNKEKLKQVVLSDKRFKHVERSAVSVINVITNSKIKFEEKGEEINMCQAIMEMREEKRLIGREETAKRMLKLGKNTLEEISICCNLDIERIKELRNEN